MSQSDLICQAGLESLLGDTFVKRVVHFAETDSTNTQTVDLLTTDGASEETCLVYAESQSAGRGRGANQWWSASGSLTFSLSINFRQFSIPAHQRPLLPLLTGMAILRTGQSVLPDDDFKLKWPNDVYLAGQKLAGILIEIPSQLPNTAVIGVGMNVNNQFAHAPNDLQSTGVSLADQSGQQHNRLEILRAFMQHFERLLNSFETGERFLDDWPRHCLLTGKQVTLQTGATQVTGICQGIAPTGAIVLETSTGRQSFFGGVIQGWA